MEISGIPCINIPLSKKNSEIIRKNWKTSILIFLSILVFIFKEYQLFLGGLVFLFISLSYSIFEKNKSNASLIISLSSLFLAIISIFGQFTLPENSNLFLTLFWSFLLLILFIYTKKIQNLKTMGRILTIIFFGYFIYGLIDSIPALLLDIIHIGIKQLFFYITTIIFFFVFLINLFLFLENLFFLFKLNLAQKKYFILFSSLCICFLIWGWYYLQIIEESGIKNFLLVLSVAFISSAVISSSLKNILE